jgi:hypothetical protein
MLKMAVRVAFRTTARLADAHHTFSKIGENRDEHHELIVHLTLRELPSGQVNEAGLGG